ncbi:sensor histidine kinase [Pedobacter aquatilis]|uniref:sensor histidine kinase n=1 Tax=Pedobacter aquatilis TaxID=351343 RepID=UPI00292CAFC9|nr:sensor histidine kinase [Pedobacter aquatilis]
MLVEKYADIPDFLSEFCVVREKGTINFPIIFEVMIWLFYVGFYKYSYLVDHARLPAIGGDTFPYREIGIYAIVSTLYLIPYYRWVVPLLLMLKRYLILFLITLFVFIFLTTYNNIGIAWIFYHFTQHQTVGIFFDRESVGFFMDWNMIMTDFIAFLSVAFARFSYQTQKEKYQIERDHLQLQLTLLKNQLQPHFLFNTLNSLYAMSLTGAKETPRFILLLSNMMQYILYECERPLVSIEGEVGFMEGYFELEQKKFPDTSISFTPNQIPSAHQIPPMLLLPLIENSFKHGRHRLDNHGSVTAELNIKDGKLEFMIKNNKLVKNSFTQNKLPGGIGLVNIKKRLELYYPKRHRLTLTESDQIFAAELIIDL